MPKTLCAEIIANGDEITSGKVLDTNSQYLSLELADLGVSTLWHTAVGDDLNAMVEVLRIAMSRADLIIWTGGLGPTADDLTRQAFADAAGVPLVKNEESLRQIEDLFKRRGWTMPAANNVQSYLPEGALPIRNPNGTAPGIDFTVKRSPHTVRLLAFPGVPAELKEMWNGSGRNLAGKMIESVNGRKQVIKFRAIHSFGLGESQVEAKLPDIVNRKHVPKVGITATGGTITLRIAAEAPTEAECDRMIEPTAKLIYDALGGLIFGEGTDTLPDVVCRMLKTKGKTIAAAEAGTRGLLSQSLAQSKESQDVFIGGIVVPPAIPVSPEKMIDLAKKTLDTDYLLLIGAYPAGEPNRIRSDETFTAVVDARKYHSPKDLQASILKIQNYPFTGHPAIIDDLYIKRVLDLLRKIVYDPQKPFSP